MRLYDILRPIAEYVSKAKKRETLRASGTVRAVVNGTVNICTLTLKPNREYLVIGGAELTISGDNIMTCSIDVKNATFFGGTSNIRTTAKSGGGCSTTVYVKTREQEGTVVLSGYGFVSGTYNYRGSLIAVEI